MKNIKKALLALILVTVLLTSCQSTDIRREGTISKGTESMEYHIPASLYVETSRPLTDDELVVASSYPEYTDILSDSDYKHIEAIRESTYICPGSTYVSDRSIFGKSEEGFAENANKIINRATHWVEANLDTPAYIIDRTENGVLLSCSYELPQLPEVHIIPGTGFTRGVLDIIISIDEVEEILIIYISVGDPEENMEADKIFINGKWYTMDSDPYIYKTYFSSPLFQDKDPSAFLSDTFLEDNFHDDIIEDYYHHIMDELSEEISNIHFI